MTGWPRALAAWLTDLLLSLVLAALVASTLGRWCAERAVLALAIDDPHSWWHGPLPLVLGAVGNLVYGVPVAILAVQLGRPISGLTFGQALWRSAPPDHSPTTFLANTLPLWLYLNALILGDLRATELLLALTALWALGRVLHRARRAATSPPRPIEESQRV